MTALSISEVASQALLDQAEYYLEQSGRKLSERWESAVFNTLLRLQRFPKSGAKCIWRAPRLRGMRYTQMEGFPNHLLFYFYDSDAKTIRVIHSLHGARDLELALSISAPQAGSD